LRLRHGSLFAAGLFAAVAVSGRPAAAANAPGALLGWVDDTRGTPVAGALISLFGKGIQGGSLVTFTDNSGRFFLPSVPAGSYILRAMEQDHLPAPPRQVTVLPNQDSIFSMSLAPLMGKLTEAETAERVRELRWLMRHKRRSTLEDRDGASPDEAQRAAEAEISLPDLAGTVEFVANSGALGNPQDSLGLGQFPSSISMVRLNGRFAESGRWVLSGLLSEADSTTWRMSGGFAVEPWTGHQIRVGSGYGTRLLRPSVEGAEHLDGGSGGAAFAEDRWRVDDRITATFGAQYSYIGFLNDRNHVDPSASVEFRGTHGSRVRGSVATSTLAPGGDLLTISSGVPPTALTFALVDPNLRPEHLVRYEVCFDQGLGPAIVGVHVFQEGTRDPLFNIFDSGGSARSLRISNGPSLSSRGVGVSLTRHLGSRASGSITYSYGRAWRADDGGLVISFREGAFHDVVARLETVVERSDTRLVAFYRINTLNPLRSDPHSLGQAFGNARFDVELHQGLPFLGALTRTDWELLFAIRNLFYDEVEGGTLDEFAVLNPPKRVLGGISVRF
jgi:hypothetical protein